MRTASLDQLVAEILTDMVFENLKLKEPCDEAQRKGLHAQRFSFSLRPTSQAACDAIDSLLNGAYGLRAHYCHSPEEGGSANSAVCHALAEAIQGLTISAGGNIFELPGELLKSLEKASAKIWFDDETDKRGVLIEDGELFSDTWIQSREDPQRVKLKLGELSAQQIETSLAKGRSMPKPLALTVKTAFTEPNGLEYIPASKESRSLQIHLMGWT